MMCDLIYCTNLGIMVSLGIYSSSLVWTRGSFHDSSQFEYSLILEGNVLEQILLVLGKKSTR